jgi:hypothetical protein
MIAQEFADVRRDVGGGASVSVHDSMRAVP